MVEAWSKIHLGQISNIFAFTSHFLAVHYVGRPFAAESHAGTLPLVVICTLM